MIFSPKLTFVANGNNSNSVGLALGETCFGSLEFTTDSFGRLSLSPLGDDLGAIFVGMVHIGSPSLHTSLDKLFDEDDTTLGEGASSELPVLEGCNVVTSIVPITTTPPSENIMALLTAPIVPLRTTTPELGTGLLPEQLQAY
jgi:hypothetical protein